MSANLFLNSSTKYVPQMDMQLTATENGGIEGTQTFIVRKSDITAGVGTGNLALFVRSSRWDQIFPEVPPLWGALTLKSVSEGSDYSPGTMALTATFTGYQFSNNGSSGEEPSVPTSSLRGNLEEMPLIDSKAWNDLSDIAKKRLGFLLSGHVLFNIETATWGSIDDDGSFNDFGSGAWPTPTGNELIFARMIAQGRTTYKAPSWNYNYRTESKTGFSAAQLNELGKIVASPPGSPVKPATGWTWMLVGPDQSQSGPDRFIKDLNFQLIPDNDENQMLYGS